MKRILLPSTLADALRNAALLDDWDTFDSLLAELRALKIAPADSAPDSSHSHPKGSKP